MGSNLTARDPRCSMNRGSLNFLRLEYVVQPVYYSPLMLGSQVGVPGNRVQATPVTKLLELDGLSAVLYVQTGERVAKSVERCPLR